MDYTSILLELYENYDADIRLIEDNTTLLYVSFPTRKPQITLKNIIISLSPWFNIGRHYTGDGVILRFQKNGELENNDSNIEWEKKA
jgi:hypothetical protein